MLDAQFSPFRVLSACLGAFFISIMFSLPNRTNSYLSLTHRAAKLINISNGRYTAINDPASSTTFKVMRNKRNVASSAILSSAGPSIGASESDYLDRKILPKVLFVLGGPGAGKGTQCEKLSLEFGMKHLSAGELLRQEISKGTESGKVISSYLKEGRIVPVKITLDLLRDAIESSNCNRYLIDGFPRNWDNVNGWQEAMPAVCDVEAVLFLECPEDELEKRLISRGATSGRSDDNLQSARKRFATYRMETLPVVNHYESMGQVVRVDGNRSQDAVFQDFARSVASFIEQEILSLTQRLLDSIANFHWETYRSLVDESLTAVEPDHGDMIVGLSHHKQYFDSAKAKPPGFGERPSTFFRIEAPVVKVSGKTAIISYKRIGETTGIDGSKSLTTFQETRVWQLKEGQWKLIHFHKSK